MPRQRQIRQTDCPCQDNSLAHLAIKKPKKTFIVNEKLKNNELSGRELHF